MKLLFFFSFFFIFSCSTPKSNFIGKYENEKPTYFNKCLNFIFKKYTTIGTELELKSNSMFIYSNCSVEFKGKWKIKKDSLFLNVENSRFWIDSLNIKNEFLTLVFSVQNRKFTQRFIDNQNNWVEEILIKNK